MYGWQLKTKTKQDEAEKGGKVISMRVAEKTRHSYLSLSL